MKKPLQLHPTSTAQWHALILEAQSSCTTFLQEELESYLKQDRKLRNKPMHLWVPYF